MNVLQKVMELVGKLVSSLADGKIDEKDIKECAGLMIELAFIIKGKTPNQDKVESAVEGILYLMKELT